jgi:hypothetical protein
MKRTLLFVLGISMFTVSGCGLLFVEGPPSTIPEDAMSVRCTESKTLPTLDHVWSGLNLIGSFILGLQHDALKREIESQPRGATSSQVEESRQLYVGALSSAVQALFFHLSGNQGRKKVSACRDAVDMIEMRNR